MVASAIVPYLLNLLIISLSASGAEIFKTRHSYCCGSDDAATRDGNAPWSNAVSSSDLRVPCLMHLNIINSQGSTATTRSNPAAVSQFQFMIFFNDTATTEKRYS